MKDEKNMNTITFKDRLKDCPATPNCVCSQASAPARHIDPLRFTGAAAIAWAGLQRLIEEMPRARIQTRDEHYLHAEFTSRVFRFVDDVEFLLADGVIHVRSASRVGRWDVGANRARVEEIRRRWSLDAEGK